jgi:hypothetical protein
MKIRYVILYAGLIITLAQCNPGGKPANNNVSRKDSFSKDSIKIDFMLLSPNEILGEMLQDTKNFNPEIVNPQSNAKKYLERKRRALNLGIYLADFAYLNINGNKTDALNYFKIIRDLSLAINIYGYFDDNFFNRVQNNLTNNDSIASLSKETYYGIVDVLQNSDRQDIYALISSGALIETMYLALMNIKDFNLYKAGAQKIFDKKDILSSYYAFALLYKDYPDVKSVLVQLESLKKILDQSKTETTKIKVAKDGNNHLIVSGGQEIIVSEKDFQKFKDDVIKTRQELISISNK